MRITHTLDDVMIQTYIDTAKAYVMDAVDHNIEENKFSEYKQFDFAVNLLSQSWYNNRNTDVGLQVPIEVTAMIQQLRGRLYETISDEPQ